MPIRLWLMDFSWMFASLALAEFPGCGQGLHYLVALGRLSMVHGTVPVKGGMVVMLWGRCMEGFRERKGRGKCNYNLKIK